MHDRYGVASLLVARVHVATVVLPVVELELDDTVDAHFAAHVLIQTRNFRNDVVRGLKDIALTDLGIFKQ